jgi:hypothetical protein
MIVNPGKLDIKIDVLTYKDGRWTNLDSLWGSADYSAKVVYSSFAAGAEGYKLTVRANNLVKLDTALRVCGKHCMIAALRINSRYVEIDAAVVAPQRCTLRRQSTDVSTFEGVLAERYVRWTQETPNAKHETGLLLITPKMIELRPGDIIAAIGGRFSVRECHMLEATHNAYEIMKTGDA